MESNWSRNVRLQGLGSLGASLAARYLLDPLPYWLVNTGVEPGGIVRIYVPPDTAPDAPYLFESWPFFTYTFPYGWPVSPP